MKEKIQRIMRKILEKNFPLYKESDRINVYLWDDGRIAVNLRTKEDLATKLPNTTHFDLEIDSEICYILDIEIEKEKRGQGYGWRLYNTVNDFARNFGCSRVRQTPSGWAYREKNGESRTRKQYLLDRGYVEVVDEELKKKGLKSLELDMILK